MFANKHDNNTETVLNPADQAQHKWAEKKTSTTAVSKHYNRILEIRIPAVSKAGVKRTLFANKHDNNAETLLNPADKWAERRASTTAVSKHYNCLLKIS